MTDGKGKSVITGPFEERGGFKLGEVVFNKSCGVKATILEIIEWNGHPHFKVPVSGENERRVVMWLDSSQIAHL